MQAVDHPYTKNINGAMQYVIPVFQRDYSWTEAKCEQLIKDILTIVNDPSDRGHFIVDSVGHSYRFTAPIALHLCDDAQAD